MVHGSSFGRARVISASERNVFLEAHQNIMGTMPIKKLLVTMSWPIMLSMFIQALYNMVDSICVSHVSDADFLALSLAYPVQMMMIAVCAGTGVGFAAVLARKLGEKKQAEAAQVACNGYLLYFISWMVFVVVIVALVKPFFRAFSDDPLVVEAGVQYLSICGIFSFGMCFQFVAERILQACGHPMQYMMVQGVGAVINIILDPVFVFGLDLGVVGAAVATVIGQITGMLLGVFLVWRCREMHVTFRGFRPDRGLIREIYRVGLPAILIQSLGSIMSFGLNFILNLFSATGVIIAGIYFKVQSFVCMPVFGLFNGLTSIVSYNYGARDKERVSGTIRFALMLGPAVMAVGALIVFFGAPFILSVGFDAAEETLRQGVPALRIVAPSFVMAGFSLMFSSSFQALGRSSYSLVLSLLRQLVLILPLAGLLCLWNPELVWLTFPITEGVAAVVAALLFRKVKRECIDTME